MKHVVKAAILVACLVAPGVASADPIADALTTIIAPVHNALQSVLPPSNAQPVDVAAPSEAAACAPHSTLRKCKRAQ